MKLKKAITKEEHDALSEAHKALYAVDGEGYKLSIEVEPDAPADNTDLLERIKRLETNNQALLDEKRRAKDEADEAKRKAAKDSGSVEELEKSWQAKYDDSLAASKKESDELRGALSSVTSGSKANEMAAAIFGEHSGALLHHIQQRLTTEFGEDGMPKTRVLGTDGKPTAMTLEELEKSLREDKRFAPFVVASRGSGGGPPGGAGNGAPGGKAFNQMNGSELKTLRQENPKEYDRLKDEYNKTLDV